MNSYLITVFILHVCALLIYELLLKKTTFLKANRAYLLIVPIILWLIPFINIGALNQEPVIEDMVVPTYFVPEEFTESQAVVEIPAIPFEVVETQKETSINFSWWWIYFLGFGISLIWFVKNYYQLRKLKEHAAVQELDGITYHKVSNSKIALSFMGSILIGDQIKSEHIESIVAHEQAHIRQKHHFDLMFFQFLGILMWCNPFHYIFLNRLKLTHELLADRAVAQQVGTKNYAQLLLKETFNTSNVAFANMFFSFKTIKTRISMLHKKSSPQIAKMRYASLFVLILTAVIYTSCTTAKEKELSLEQQISNLDKTLKSSDSVSFENIKAIDGLLSKGYTFEKGAEYAKLIGEEEERLQREFEKSPEGIAWKEKFNEKYDSIEESKYEAEVEKRVAQKLKSMEPKKQQPMIYLKRTKNGPVIKSGFEIPRTKSCLSKSGIELRKCVIDELTSFFVEKINKDLDKKFTSYGNTLHMDINKNGGIENLEDAASSINLGLTHQDQNVKFKEILNEIEKDLPTLIPATMDGEPIEVTIILPIKVR